MSYIGYIYPTTHEELPQPHDTCSSISQANMRSCDSGVSAKESRSTDGSEKAEYSRRRTASGAEVGGRRMAADGECRGVLVIVPYNTPTFVTPPTSDLLLPE